jgi:hypothetical protein
MMYLVCLHHFPTHYFDKQSLVEFDYLFLEGSYEYKHKSQVKMSIFRVVSHNSNDMNHIDIFTCDLWL